MLKRFTPNFFLTSFVVLFCLASLTACGDEAGSDGQKGTTTDTGKPPKDSMKVTKVPDKPLIKEVIHRDTITTDEFKAAFKYDTPPKEFRIEPDFREKLLPELPHFKYLALQLDPNMAIPFKMEDFYAYSLRENSAGNWEIVSIRANDTGAFMYISILHPNFSLINSIEVARATEHNGTRIHKHGNFTNDQTYQYFYTLHNNNILQDSLSGKQIIPPTGNVKFLNEQRLN
ncbi:MAG: hypothetical protein AAF570_04605 [Bacteroidota bacterium]